LQPDPNTWSLHYWYTHVPITFWLAAGSGLIFLCGVAYNLGKWVAGKAKEREISKLEEELNTEKARPQANISISDTSLSIGKFHDHMKYSFNGDNLIHPGIIEELKGWLSDPLPVTGAFDLQGAMASNKFYKPFESSTSASGERWVRIVEKENGKTISSFSYAYVATSPAGVHIIQTADWGGGSGVFCDILLLVMETDRIVDFSNKERLYRDRVLLKCIGNIALGDRYAGTISYVGNQLHIGENQNLHGHWTQRGIIKID